MKTQHFRVATYNIHKCRGMDRRVSPVRIAEVLLEVDADVVALQEVLRGEHADHDQPALIAERAGYKHICFGENRKHRGAGYGNAILSRFQISEWKNYDLTHSSREPRGLLRADVEIARQSVHVLNVHLGTGYMERRAQAKALLHEDVLLDKDLEHPRILLGDFNEWTRGMVTKQLSTHMRSAELSPEQKRPRRIRSYPGVLPVMHLDHIYYDPHLQLRAFLIHRSARALVASDHLPLVADFGFSAP